MAGVSRVNAFPDRMRDGKDEHAFIAGRRGGITYQIRRNVAARTGTNFHEEDTKRKAGSYLRKMMSAAATMQSGGYKVVAAKWDGNPDTIDWAALESARADVDTVDAAEHFCDYLEKYKATVRELADLRKSRDAFDVEKRVFNSGDDLMIRVRCP